jgi:hypothetical protein
MEVKIVYKKIKRNTKNPPPGRRVFFVPPPTPKRGALKEAVK